MAQERQLMEVTATLLFTQDISKLVPCKTQRNIEVNNDEHVLAYTVGSNDFLPVNVAYLLITMNATGLDSIMLILIRD